MARENERRAFPPERAETLRSTPHIFMHRTCSCHRTSPVIPRVPGILASCASGNHRHPDVMVIRKSWSSVHPDIQTIGQSDIMGIRKS